MTIRIIYLSIAFLLLQNPLSTTSYAQKLQTQIEKNAYFNFVRQKAQEIVQTGFNAGDGNGDVRIRDYNPFIELSAKIYEPATVKENLLVLFKIQEQEYWIVNSENKEVMGYFLEEGSFKESLNDQGVIRSRLLDYEIQF